VYSTFLFCGSVADLENVPLEYFGAGKKDYFCDKVLSNQWFIFGVADYFTSFNTVNPIYEEAHGVTWFRFADFGAKDGYCSSYAEFSRGVETYSFLSKNDREDFLNRSKLVVSRSGYSTILDLAVIGTKALMTPTPGQVEQEYLARYHNQKGTFYSVNQNDIDLIRDVKIAQKTTGITRKCDVDKTVENIMNIVNNIKSSSFR